VRGRWLARCSAGSGAETGDVLYGSPQYGDCSMMSPRTRFVALAVRCEGGREKSRASD